MSTYIDNFEKNNRLYTNNREPDQQFDDQENLYRRIPNNACVNGILSPIALKFDDDSGQSFNRSRYSIPSDVLEPECCDGKQIIQHDVYSMKASCLPFKIPASGEPAYAFQMKHVPKPTCYAHSELWCNQGGRIEAAYECPPKRVKIELRIKLALCLKPLHL